MFLSQASSEYFFNPCILLRESRECQKTVDEGGNLVYRTYRSQLAFKMFAGNARNILLSGACGIRRKVHVVEAHAGLCASGTLGPVQIHLAVPPWLEGYPFNDPLETILTAVPRGVVDRLHPVGGASARNLPSEAESNCLVKSSPFTRLCMTLQYKAVG